jgi:coenzyme F420-reducing hydrogenase alpha subunit
MELLAGRATHPVTFKPGGFSKLPTAAELRDLQGRLKAVVPDLSTLANLVASLAPKLPAFERPTEYVALVHPGVYTFYDGRIGSTDTPETVPVQRFESVVNEYVSPRSTAKWCRWHRETYAVGSLARYNLSAASLLPLAKETARTLGLKPGACNPYLNSVAQVVECVQVVEHSLQLIDRLLTVGIRPEKPRVQVRAGNGAGAVEAPRGVLFHRYVLDEHGRCTAANLCIPTGQNHANIQGDLEALVPQIIARGEDEVRLLLEMLVRSYDPCISCSTHYLDVEFV